MKTACIILAGGRSRRMGTHKALLKVHNKSLLDIAAEKFSAIGSHIFISSRKDIPLKTKHNVIYDHTLNQGPLSGIIRIMQEIDAQEYCVLAVDLPNIPENFFTDLLQHFRDDADAIVPYNKGFAQPLAAVYRSNCLPVFQQQFKNGFKAIQKSFNDLRIQKYPVQANDDIFLNINSMADYQNYLKYYAKANG